MHRKYAQLMMKQHFKYAYYIGRHRLHDQKADLPPHRFYYIGHGDSFGVAMPEIRNKWGFQIWGISWVRGRSVKLDKAVASALKGKFPDCRHNVQLEKRAKQYGQKAFVKPTWIYEAPPAAKKNSTEKFPLRRKSKRQRRKLNF